MRTEGLMDFREDKQMERYDEWNDEGRRWSISDRAIGASCLGACVVATAAALVERSYAAASVFGIGALGWVALILATKRKWWES